jgi:hypothetical protein
MSQLLLSVHLFTNPVADDPPPVREDFIEPTFPGYSAAHCLPFRLPLDDVRQVGPAARFDLVFRRGLGGDATQLRGYFVLAWEDGEPHLIGWGRFDPPQDLTPDHRGVGLTLWISAIPFRE